LQRKRVPKRRLKILEGLHHRRHSFATYDIYE
jgi:hypothetical protein